MPERTRAELTRLRAKRERLALQAAIAQLQARREPTINSPELLRLTVKSLWSALGYDNSTKFLQAFISNPKWLEAYELTRELLVRALETEKA